MPALAPLPSGAQGERPRALAETELDQELAEGRADDRLAVHPLECHAPDAPGPHLRRPRAGAPPPPPAPPPAPTAAVRRSSAAPTGVAAARPGRWGKRPGWGPAS